MDIPFVEFLRTAQTLDDNRLSKLDGLVNIQRPPECLVDDAARIIQRLALIMEQPTLVEIPLMWGLC